MTQTRPPDVYVVMLDTLRFGAGPTGPHAHRLMPRLAAWARDEAVGYPRAVSVAPWTLPSHGSLFTGAYPSAHGATELHQRFDPPQPTMAELLKDRGYRTGAVSANAWVSPDVGFGRGFDAFQRVWQLNQADTDLLPLMKESHHLSRNQKVLAVLRTGRPSDIANAAFQYGRKRLLWGDFNAGRVNREALQLVDAAGPDPVFLFLNYMDAHGPYWATRRYRRRALPRGVGMRRARRVCQNPLRVAAGDARLGSFDRRVLLALYEAEASYLDDRVGQLFDGLGERGRFENAVVVVLSDHGENVGEHGMLGHFYGVWETLLHVPLLVRYPDRTGAGAADDRLAQTVDVLPTVAELTGIDPTGYQGRSLRTAPPRDVAVAEYLAPMPSLDLLRRRYPTADAARYDRSLRVLRTADDLKLVWDAAGPPQLFDLRADPAETHDLAAERDADTAALGRELAAWVEAYAAGAPAAPGPGAAAPDDEVRHQLESLGYLG